MIRSLPGCSCLFCNAERAIGAGYYSLKNLNDYMFLRRTIALEGSR